MPLTAPGNTDGFGDTATQAARLRLFSDRYGLQVADRAALIDVVTARLQGLVGFMRTQAAAGSVAFAGHLAAGHHLRYLGDADYVQRERATFTEALLTPR